MKPSEPAPQQLQRVVGLPGAVTLGLGSILGTGGFVSLLFAVQLAGEWALLSVTIAAGLAVCNGLSSAQLAASHPVSGGAYEYGYRYLTPALGFNAGWMFLIAKGASAATAALAFSECIRQVIPATQYFDVRILAGVTIATATALVLSGVRRSVRVNAAIVGLVLLSLIIFVIAAWSDRMLTLTFEAAEFSYQNVFHATALCFVAYTGYGRVATMGEEIRDPSRNIPRAVIATLVATFLVYIVVATAVVAAVSTSPGLIIADSTRSLGELLAASHANSVVVTFVRTGSMVAMFGVLLNLVLGLSRVALAMARRCDLPSSLAKLSSHGQSPQRAVLLVAVVIGCLTLVGDLFRTWSISAFAVLIYYATANLCALRQSAEERRYPRIVPAVGFCGCLCVIPFIDLKTIAGGTLLIVSGLVVRLIAGFRKRKRPVT